MGDRGCGRTPSFRDLIPCRPNGSPFELYWDIHFWLTDPKIFLMAPLAPIYTKFKRGARVRKKVDKIWNFFEKPPPPFEKILDTTLVLTSLLNYWFLSFVENSFMKSCSNVLKIYQNIYQRCFFSFDQFSSSRLQVLMDFFCITLNILELELWKTIL